MNPQKLKQIMAKVKAFPAMPATATKLLALIDDPEVSFSQIEEIIRYDPGLTANILKLTNSAYFGIPLKVSSVRQAMTLLGWKRLVQLVMTLCMSTLMNKPVPGYDLPQGELWRHSIAVSIAAENIVKMLGLPDVDEVFTAALLHDVGKLILGGFVKRDLEFIEDMVAKGFSFDVAEHIILGTDHAEVGSRILKQWSFPDELINAVGWHHNPESCENYCMLSDIVHIANNLGQMIGAGRGREEFHSELSLKVIENLGLKPVDLEDIADRTLAGVNKLADVL
ncbi:MAG: HDOD domain-containing protein [Desulfobacterales bacterium]|nr:MAG: HDOD domain-containing protein [Desulfobacterales bacterium]